MKTSKTLTYFGLLTSAMLATSSLVRGATIVLVQDSLITPTTTQINGNANFNTPPQYSTGRTPDVEADAGQMYEEGPFTHFYTTATGAKENDSLNAFVLPVTTVTSGHIYTLSVVESGGDNLSNGSNLAQLSFDNLTTDSNLAFYSSTGPSVAVLANGQARGFGGRDNVYAYGSGSALTDGVVDGIAGPNTLKLVLDTTASVWTVSNYVNGVYEGTLSYDGYTGPDNTQVSTPDANHMTAIVDPTINGIALSDGGGNPYFSDLSLTEFTPDIVSAPEPTSIAYLILGGGSLLWFVRRKRTV